MDDWEPLRPNWHGMNFCGILLRTPDLKDFSPLKVMSQSNKTNFFKDYCSKRSESRVSKK